MRCKSDSSEDYLGRDLIWSKGRTRGCSKMCMHVEASFQRTDEVICLLLHDTKQHFWDGMYHHIIEQVDWNHDLIGDG